jgi:DNA-binding CsgD family transcriptional regulator
MSRSQASTGNPLRVVAGGRDDGSKTAQRGNLPLETTSFVGRERELGEVEELLGRTRLLTLVGEGLADARIAERLYFNRRTVGNHLSSAYRKLGAKRRTAAVKKAGELGLI